MAHIKLFCAQNENVWSINLSVALNHFFFRREEKLLRHLLDTDKNPRKSRSARAGVFSKREDNASLVLINHTESSQRKKYDDEK